jgi:hypothetical protein
MVPWFFNKMAQRHIFTQSSVPISTQCFLANGLDVWDPLHGLRADTVRFVKDVVYVPVMPAALHVQQQRNTEAANKLGRDMLRRMCEGLAIDGNICRVTKGSHIGQLQIKSKYFLISCKWSHAIAAPANFMACIGKALYYNQQIAWTLPAFCEKPKGSKQPITHFMSSVNMLWDLF